MGKGAAKPVKISSAAKPSTLFDEELWFGTTDSEAAEEAAAKSMAATAGKVIGAKPFPESARKLAMLASRETTQIQEFVEVLEQDPALSAKILRIVNSPGFGLRQRCTSIRHAVTIVGSKYLHRVATTAAVLNLFDSDTDVAVDVLEHCAVVGAFCRYFGAHLGLPVEDLFTIGVLHDIGKLMMLDAFGVRYNHLVSQSNGEADAIHVLERAEFGFDHGILAAHVLKAWNIPEPIPKIVAWHHEPGKAYASSPVHATMVQTARLCDLLAVALSRGATETSIEQLARSDSAVFLEISEAQLGAMWNDLVQVHAHTLEQKRGESSTKLEVPVSPAKPGKALGRSLSLSAKVPKQFSCIECGQPSFGATCPACKGHLCPAHPLGSLGWCGLCTGEYSQFSKAIQGYLNPKTAVVVSALLCVTFLVKGWMDSGARGALRELLIACFLSAFLVFVGALGRRSYLRARFLRHRPDRSAEPASAPAAESVQVPPNT